jgi:phosphoglycolate phosphatase-like HAD superfamily hydrolase
MKNKKIILLWDIDGTLLDTKGVGLKAIKLAINDIFQAEVILQRKAFSGLTDHEIFYSIVSENFPQHLNEKNLSELIMRYEHHLENVLSIDKPKAIANTYNNFTKLIQQNHFEHWVGTGNTFKGARIKLGKAGYGNYFSDEVIFYSSKNEPRCEIINRAKRRLNSDSNQMIVIGDTPRDYKAAAEAELKCVTIATGLHTFEELNNLNPGMTLNDEWQVSDLFHKINSEII